jgi:uncharacterized YccA/Bax inhibitor family protein
MTVMAKVIMMMNMTRVTVMVEVMIVRVTVMMKMTVTVMSMVGVMVRVTVHNMKQQNTVSILRYRLSACVCAGAVQFSSNNATQLKF